MKKKILIIGIVILLLVVLIALLNDKGNEVLIDNVEIVKVQLTEFQEEYELTGKVTSNNTTFYYNGYLEECSLTVGQHVSKKSVLLKYLNFNNESTELVTSISGYVVEVTSNSVTIQDDNFFIQANVDDSLADKLTNTTGLFSCNEKLYNVTFANVSDYGNYNNGQVSYVAKFSLEDTTGLKLNQRGNLTIYLSKQTDVLVIDKEAVYEDEEGFYLIDASFLDDLDNYKDYKVRIEVLNSNDEICSVTGVGIEDKDFCIINEDIRSLLEDD